MYFVCFDRQSSQVRINKGLNKYFLSNLVYIFLI